MRAPRLVAAACFALASCTETVHLGEEDALAGLVDVTVTPGDQTVEITDLARPPGPIAYTATGRFADGSERDVTGLVTWRVDNPAPGAFTGGNTFQPSARAAGHVTVSAVAGPVTGSARLHVVITLAIVDAAAPPPAGAAELFAPGVPIVTGHPARSPSVLYPSAGTKFPPGLARVLFQHRRGWQNDVLRLTFDSDVLHLSVLTTADRWLPDEAIWTLLAASHPGAETTLVATAASSVQRGKAYASAPVPLSFAPADPGGVIYLWSGTTNGVYRTLLDAPAAAPLYPATGDTSCIGCHVVSRDGRQMAFGYGGQTLQSVDLDTLAPSISAAADHGMGWATYSPDGTLLLLAHKGELFLRDARTGAPVGSPGGRIPLPRKATHPDWSPDGSYVAVALSDDISNLDVAYASIARIPYRNGRFGAPEILVAGGSSSNNYFPRWSPDGKHLAYVHATTASRGARSAELRLVRAGGGAPVTLRRASHRVGTQDDVPDLASTMPSWAPSSDGGLAWLVFTSTRPYGAVMPTAERAQIWIAALDLDREGDPSFAAFWLPSQDVWVSHHNPIWAPALTPPAQ